MKISKTNYLLLNLSIILLSLFLFNGCQQDSSINEPNFQKSNVLEKDGLRIPDVYVHGYIDDDGKAAKYASVKLLDENGYLLTSTTANGSGNYSMLICPYGYGFRTVEATYSGETGSNHFRFVYGTWDYTVDVTIGSNPDKNNN